MSGRRWEDLPRPRPGFRPGEDTRSKDGNIRFEALENCREEDRRNADAIKRQLHKLDPTHRLAARRLAGKLLRAAKRPGMAPETLASSVYARDVRYRIVGNIWPLAEDSASAPMAFVTLLRRQMWVPDDELMGIMPRNLNKRLINDLNLAGVTKAGGWLYGTLDAEFDTRRGGYDFHHHLIVAGDKVAALEGLRGMTRYALGRYGAHEEGRRKVPRLQIKPVMGNLPDPLTYATKFRVFEVSSYIGEDGTIQTGTYIRRVPQPHLSHWLLWMDKWRVSDLLITQGLRLTASGIRRKTSL